MNRVPIACTLTADAMVDRLLEWENVLSTMVGKVDHQGRRATLTLLPGTEPLLTATDLAEREKACCSFFEFSIEVNGVDTRLHIEVPDEAESILADLVALGPAHLGSV